MGMFGALRRTGHRRPLAVLVPGAGVPWDCDVRGPACCSVWGGPRVPGIVRRASELRDRLDAHLIATRMTGDREIIVDVAGVHRVYGERSPRRPPLPRPQPRDRRQRRLAKQQHQLLALLHNISARTRGCRVAFDARQRLYRARAMTMPSTRMSPVDRARDAVVGTTSPVPASEASSVRAAWSLRHPVRSVCLDVADLESTRGPEAVAGSTGPRDRHHYSRIRPCYRRPHTAGALASSLLNRTMLYHAVRRERGTSPRPSPTLPRHGPRDATHRRRYDSSPPP